MLNDFKGKNYYLDNKLYTGQRFSKFKKSEIEEEFLMFDWTYSKGTKDQQLISDQIVFGEKLLIFTSFEMEKYKTLYEIFYQSGNDLKIQLNYKQESKISLLYDENLEQEGGFDIANALTLGLKNKL